MIKGLVSVGVLCLLVGCDGLNSSFDKNNNQSGQVPQTPPVTKKPVSCNFDFAKTCWADSVAEITACLDPIESEEIFNQTKEFCSNAEQKITAFSNPQSLFALPFDIHTTPIDFRIFPDSVNQCLRVTGTAQKFRVVSGAKSISFDFTTDKMKFTCTDGQIVQVPYDVFEDCAEALGEKFVNTVPGLEMSFSQKSGKGLWAFRLRGAPEAPDLFRCVEP